MTIEEIIKYVFDSPENTNVNVLRSMLEELVTIGNGPIPGNIVPPDSSGSQK